MSADKAELYTGELGYGSLATLYFTGLVLANNSLEGLIPAAFASRHAIRLLLRHAYDV